MKVVLFVVDDLHFVPNLNKPIIEKYGNDVVQVYISKSLFSFKKIKKNISFFIKNRYPFPIKFKDLYKFIKWQLKLKSNGADGHKTLHDFFSSHGISTKYIETLNGKSFHEELRELDADVFLFSPFDKIAGPKFIAIPKLGAFNIHLGKIPEYKGGFSAFWVLSKNDSTAGASIHRLANKIDEGELIEEVRFNVEKKTMISLMDDTIKHASAMTLKGLENIENGNIKSVSIEGRDSDYLLYPTKEAFMEFYKNGNSLL